MNKCKKCESTDIKINTVYKYHDIYECLNCGDITYKRIDECCRNPYSIVVIDRRNHDLFFLYRQCLDCGGSINRAKPLNSKVFGNDIEGEFNWDTFNNWKAERNKEGKILYEDKKLLNYQHSKYYKYLIYLSSDKWKEKRKLVLERENKLCQRCKERPADDIHHLNYDNLYNETLEDLQALCKICHAKEHNKALIEQGKIKV